MDRGKREEVIKRLKESGFKIKRNYQYNGNGPIKTSSSGKKLKLDI